MSAASNVEAVEAALRESERMYRLLVANLLGAVYRRTDDDDWSAIFFSGMVEAITGYSPSDFLGNRVRSFASIIFPDDLETAQRAIGAALAHHEPFSVEYRIVHANGRTRWVSDRGRGVYSEQGKLRWVDGIVLDLTERRRVDEPIRASDEHFQRLQDAISVGVVVHARDGTIIQSNRAARDILGLTDDQIRGRTSLDARWHAVREDGSQFPGADHPAMVTLRTGKAVHDVVMGIPFRETGARRWILINSKPVFDVATGELREVVATFIDITEQKRAEERLEAERQWLRTVIEHSPVGIMLIEDAEGKRISANRRAAEIFGQPLTPERGIAQYANKLYHVDGSPVAWEELASFRALGGEVVKSAEELLRRRDGRELSLQVNAAPIRDATGTITGAVVIFEDVTAAKDFERLREEWTSIIAHDLRQPVTIIVGYAGLLTKQADKMSAPLRRPVEHIRVSAQQLNRMIADLLDASRIEAHRLTLERKAIDLCVLLPAIVERAAEITAGHPVRLVLGRQIPNVSADSVRLEQILDNLLSNAAKYSYPDTEIRVEVDRRDDHAEVAIVNVGDGIPPDDLPRLFSRYHRTRLATEKPVAGLGLGLYITKGLVEAHGGRIWVESTPGETTTFRFTLPFASSSPSP